VFVNTPYASSHSENNAVGTSVYRVSAIDNDLVGRINYDVIGDGIAPYYYAVNSQTGEVTIRNALTTDRLNVNYVVSIVSARIVFYVGPPKIFLSVLKKWDIKLIILQFHP
jgi:hypothetical protein